MRVAFHVSHVSHVNNSPSPRDTSYHEAEDTRKRGDRYTSEGAATNMRHNYQEEEADG